MKNCDCPARLYPIVAVALTLMMSSCAIKPIDEVKVVEEVVDKIAKPEVSAPPDFINIKDSTERKRAFIAFFTPILAKQNQLILRDREQLLALAKPLRSGALSKTQENRVLKFAVLYRMPKPKPVDSGALAQLLRRVDAIPPALALAQSANESAWGTSRFAREGNNYFGQWCFRQGCGLVPKQRKAGLTHEVERFDDAEASVKAYLKNINTHRAYAKLRDIRQTARAKGKALDSLELAHGLIKYSERGQEYVRDIQAMIRRNSLMALDLAYVK